MAKAVRKKAEESEGLKIGANPLPISFKEFSKNPVVGMLFFMHLRYQLLVYGQCKAQRKARRKDRRFVRNGAQKR